MINIGRNGRARVIPVSVVDRAIVDGPELSSEEFQFQINL